jgi:zinc transport system substrate-binding protein
MSVRTMKALIKFAVCLLLLGILNPLRAGGRVLKITASIFPLMDFARQVAGDRAEVRLLLPPGADVHTWQPRPGEMLRLSRTDLFLFCGDNLEPWAEDLSKSYRQAGGQVLEAGAGLASRKLGPDQAERYGPEAADPHVWLDLSLAETIVRRIEQKLAELDPNGQDTYRRRSDSYIHDLRALDRVFRERLLKCRSRTIVLAGHAAFGHLASRYGLRQVSPYGLSPDTEPAPRQVVGIIELMKKEGLSTVFFIQYESRKMAEVLARETKTQLMPLNPAQNLSPSDFRAGMTFLDIMKENLKSLEQGLGCAEK